MQRTFLIPLLSIVLCVACAVPALAQGLPGAAVRPDTRSGAPADRDPAKGRMQERCQDNPQQCEEMKAKMRERREERCKANPQRCEKMKAKMTERREQCKADPQKCRDEMKARREERCKANPQRCEEMKARIKDRQAQCKADPDKCAPGKGLRPDGK